MPKSLGGYQNGSSRCRFNARFEVIKRPIVQRCELTREDWGLPDSVPQDSVQGINRAITNCINMAHDRHEAEKNMALVVSGFGLTADDRANVLSVINRLLRVVFD